MSRRIVVNPNGTFLDKDRNKSIKIIKETDVYNSKDLPSYPKYKSEGIKLTSKEIELIGLVNWVAKKSNNMSILVGKNNGLIRYSIHIPLNRKLENIKYGNKVRIIIEK